MLLRDWRIYRKLIKINFLSGFQYKGWFLMIIMTLSHVVTDPVGLIFMFHRFGDIGPWSMERILLIYAMAVASFGLAECFCRGFDYFPWRMIRQGEFDRVLLRPRSLAFQVAGSYFHIHRFARVAGGLFAIGWSLCRQGVTLGVPEAAILVLALTGGFLTYSGVFVLTSGLAFFTIQSVDWIYILTNVSYQVTHCPMDYMPPALKRMFTFFMPMLVISYYPASVICGWGEPLWKGLLALPAGFMFLFAAGFMWRFGVKHYNSAGS